MHRRFFVRSSLAGLTLAALPGLSRAQCGSLTEPNIEGPFFRPDAPWRTDLAESAPSARPLRLTGVVRDPGCRPLADAVLEVWHADGDGDYDLRGDTFRGRLRTDAQGRFALHTIVPGRYRTGSQFRPAHVHVKVHPNGRPPLTTQLYFPNDPHADTDPWFRSSLLVRVAPSPLVGGCGDPRAQVLDASFDFVV
ncbi:MAG: hypothetical protein H6721_21465 [Sandaracinus sp.]|nr:hypothetical protein [Sandaracinus sp.]MCB9611924.1 hypothetical protein [Sandaracinus sp.]MCB9634704.1 hypothetical protein [Sandaracinus sp.]